MELGRGHNIRLLAYVTWMIHLPIEKTQAVIKRLQFPASQAKVVHRGLPPVERPAPVGECQTKQHRHKTGRCTRAGNLCQLPGR